MFSCPEMSEKTSAQELTLRRSADGSLARSADLAFSLSYFSWKYGKIVQISLVFCSLQIQSEKGIGHKILELNSIRLLNRKRHVFLKSGHSKIQISTVIIIRALFSMVI